MAAISIRRQRAGRPISTFHSILTLKRRLRNCESMTFHILSPRPGMMVVACPPHSRAPLSLCQPKSRDPCLCWARVHGAMAAARTALWPWGRLALASCLSQLNPQRAISTGILLSPGPHHDILSLDTPSRHGSHSRRLQEDRSCTSGSIPTIAPIVWLIVTY